MQVQSQEVCCCGARTWSQVIGWLQLIFSGFYLLICFVLLLNKDVLLDKFEQSDVFTAISIEERVYLEKNWDFLIDILIAIFVTISLIQVFAAISLLMGVKQKNPRKVKVWLVIQVVFVVMEILSVLNLLAKHEGYKTGFNIVLIAMTLFAIYVVDVHRKELLTAKLLGHIQAETNFNFSGEVIRQNQNQNQNFFSYPIPASEKVKMGTV